jgi:SAM-dependent methyltransferase
VLDVGVSPLVDLPAENDFLRRYPYPEQVTAVSNDPNLDPVRAAFPGVSVLTADALALPFGDSSVDVVHSNAVIEHVGSGDEQARFVAELVRVGRAGAISTPLREFPIDSHTNLPLLHWLPRPAFLASLRRLGRLGPGEEWVTWLLSRREFRRLIPPELEVRIVTQRLAGLPAVATVFFRHP